MQNDLISIIVPNYNNEKYIEECLDSILSQTYKHIEIVIIDDASKDNSKEIINSYTKKYKNIKTIFNDQNKGVTKNRDTAIKEASGEYITTLDGDDFYIDNQKLEKEMNLIQEFVKKGSKDIIVFSNIILVDRIGKRLFPKAKNNIKEGNIFKALFSRSCMIPRDFIFTKEQYIKAGKFDINIPIYEDWDLKIRLAKQNNFYYSGVDGIGYRRHGEGLSSANHATHIKWLKYIFNKNRFLLEKEDRDEMETKLNQFMKKAFNSSLKNKLREKVRKLISWRNNGR